MSEGVEREHSDSTGERGSSRWIIAGILAFAALLIFGFTGRFGVNPRLVDSPLVGQPLPDVTLDYLESEGTLSLHDLAGKNLVVNVWASWCVPCRFEHPALSAAATVYESRNLHFVGILYQDRPADAIRFLDEFGRSDNYSYVVDSESRATVELGVFGVPETYFVDSNGIIQGRFQGELTPTLLIEAIEDLLAGRPLEL